MVGRMTLGLAAALACLAAVPASAQPSVRAGVEAWQRGDYEAAVRNWRPLAERGDTDAQFNLGQAYKLGRGVKADLAAAQTWLDRAARRGHVEAQTSLGLLLFQNGNRVAALRWLRSAADKGEPRAMVVYSTALYNGDGVARDPVRAYAYMRRAAETGFAPAAEALAQMDQALPAADRQRGAALASTMDARPAAPTSRLAVDAVKPVRPASDSKSAPAAKSAARPVAAAKPTPAPKPAVPKPVVAAAKPTPTPKPVVAKPVVAPKPTPAVKVAAEAKRTPPAPTGAGSWRLQLGAFSQRGAAEALFRRISSDAPLAGKQAFLTPAGAVTRLQAGPFPTRAAAVAACETLQGRGQPCFVVRP